MEFSRCSDRNDFPRQQHKIGPLNRRAVLGAGVAAAITQSGLSRVSASDPHVNVTTYTYKRVGNLEIKADVHRPDDDVLRPVVVWIHGGALINGHRGGINGRVKDRMLESGYVLVSIDYRLAPETRLPFIVQDVQDACRWIRSEGRTLFRADTRRLAVMGGSAGGCLTLTAGYRVIPRPAVLVSFWGYGDLIGDWYSEPSPHPRHNRIRVTEDSARAQVTGPPISDARDRNGNGSLFYVYCRQRGIWPFEVTGWNPKTQPQKFYPWMAVRNVTPDYPPTMLIHGTDDTDVPWEQSAMMAEQFRKHGVEHRLISIQNGEHGLGGGDPAKIDEAYASAFEFVDRHMKN